MHDRAPALEPHHSAGARAPRRLGLASLLVAAWALTSGCASQRPLVAETPRVGLASYYGTAFQGRVTASGERYDAASMTAAHRSLPFGTRVRVTNLANGRDIVVRINDRGPSRRERIIDVSLRAARKLGFGRQGITRVRLEVL